MIWAGMGEILRMDTLPLSEKSIEAFLNQGFGHPKLLRSLYLRSSLIDLQPSGSALRALFHNPVYFRSPRILFNNRPVY